MFSPAPPPAAASAVVVGGGIIGLSVAFELARRHLDVLVLERDRIGAGAAAAAAGMLAPASEAEHEDPALLELALDSLRRYPDFVRDIEQAGGTACHLERQGTVIVALTRDDEEELAHLARFQERLGLHCEWVEPDKLHRMEPQLSPRVLGGLWAAGDHQVDPRTLLSGLARAIAALGGRVVTGARVTGFETRGGRLWRVVGHETSSPARGFAVECEWAVLAAGAWSSTDLAWPARPLGVRPVKGQIVRLKGPRLLQRVVRGPRVYLVPRPDGELVVGATMEEQGFDPAPTAGAVMDLLWNARLVVPGIYDLYLAEVNVGFRPATRDHRPVIGPTEVPGLLVATGHFRHGVLLAPATATLLADHITGGRLPPQLAPFSPQVSGELPGSGEGVRTS